jgi:hypothetical protein
MTKRPLREKISRRLFPKAWAEKDALIHENAVICLQHEVRMTLYDEWHRILEENK